MTRFDYDWMSRVPADCNPGTGDLFFPDEPGHRGRRQAEVARNICRSCPVQAPCRDLMSRTGSTYGVWAGAPT